MEFQLLSNASDKRGPVLCDRCSSIVTSEITKCTDLLVSVSAVLSNTLWQASYFPVQSEIDVIETRLDELYTQREAFNDEIVRVRKMLGMLKTNRQGINRCIEGCESLFAPIRRLPVDVLIRIFREALCFDAVPSRSFSDVFQCAVITPLQLAKVCHLWREIIFQNPLLWTYQQYGIDESTSVGDISSIYRKQSFAHSLDVLVYPKYTPNYRPRSLSAYDLVSSRRHRTREMQWLMEKLDCKRWRRFSWNRQDFTAPTMQFDWPALEVLEIESNVIVPGKSPFARAPQLRTLRIVDSYHHSYVSDYYDRLCPWAQIEDLWIVDVEVYWVNQCSTRSLRRLTVQCGSSDTLANVHLELLACLEELRFLGGCIVGFLKAPSVLGVMDSLASLELSVLETACPIWAGENPTAEVAPCPSLQKLTIRDLYIKKSTLIPLIRALENLKSLVIIEPRSLHPMGRVSDGFLAAEKDNEIISSDVLSVLRGYRLEHLELVLAKDPALLGRQADVVETIEHLHAISLKSAVVGIRGGVEPFEDTLERMQKLRRDGLQIWLA